MEFAKRTLVLRAAVLGLLLVPFNATGLHVAPPKLITTLNPNQQMELLQWVLTVIPDPQLAQKTVQQGIIIKPPEKKDKVQIIIREDTPGEIGPLGVYVAGDTVEDAEIFTLAGDGAFHGPPAYTSQFSWGSAVIFQGTPSLSRPLVLRAELELMEIH